MKDIAKKMYRTSITTSLIYLLIGVILLFVTDSVLITISRVLGIILLVAGLFPVISYFKDNAFKDLARSQLIGGIFLIVSGIIMILNPTLIGTIIPIVIGVCMIISSISKVTYALMLRENKVQSWNISLIFAIITLLVGLFLVIKPWAATGLIFQIIGVIIIIYSILEIIETIIIGKKVKNTENIIETNIKIIDEK